MKWTELEVHNFLSYKHFKLALDSRGLLLIEGENLTNSKFKSNGSGKSSLLEPIVYALYNTTSKGIKSDDVVNNRVGKDAAVILTGTKGGDEYRIERYRKHKKHKDKVKLFRNGEEITAKSAADTNTAIEQLIGIDYNTFVNSIMFSQGSGAGRFAVATDREKKEILENLVNLEVYAIAQDIAKKRIKEKDTLISDNLRAQERQNWELQQVDALEAQDKANYENTRNLIKQEDQSMAETIEAFSAYTQANTHVAVQLKDEIEELQKQQQAMGGTDISEVSNKASQLLEKVRAYKNEIQQVTYKKTDLVGKYKKIETSTHCPVCGSEMDRAHRDQEMETIKGELRTVLIQQKKLEAELAPIEAESEQANAAYREQKTIQDKGTQAYQQLTNTINSKQQLVQSYERTVQAFKDKMENIRTTLQKLRTMPEPAPREKDRKGIRAKIKELKTAQLALEKEKSQLEDAVKIYSNSGVKSHVLDLITPFLNERANKYLSALSGPEMEVKFSTQTTNKAGDVTDKFDLQLINHAGGDGYKSNSEGEKKRADLAIALAIQDLVMSRAESATNFIVYDEVFDALDSVGSENVVTLLRERLDIVNSIFVITHSEHLSNLFEKVITVTKNSDGISTIKEGAEIT